MAPLTILGIAGSLRRQSYNKSALRVAQQLCPEGAKLEVFDLAGIPPFNQDDERNAPPRVAEFKQRIRAADAILIATPEYNYGVPGVLKNAIDVGSRPYGQSVWSKKPAAVISNSPGNIGGFGANQHLRQCFVFLDMPILQQPEAYVANVAKLLGDDGRITADESREFLTKLMQAFAAWIETNSGNGKLDQARAA